MQIYITVPDEVVDATWLRKQLKILSVIKETSPEGGFFECVNFYDDREGGYGPSADAFLLATDESFFDGYHFDIKARVLFHTDGTAYIDPLDEVVDSSCASGGTKHENDHLDKWTKGTWADGLLALAQSVVGRLEILDTDKGDQISQALQHLVETVGDTKVPMAQLEVEP